MKNFNGIWFFGLSGVGKSFASEFLLKKLPNAIKLDGDIVRRYISYDLGYSISERKIQLSRIFNLAQLLIFERKIPIISTVYFDNNLLKKTLTENIAVFKIQRANGINKKLVNQKKNVVGVDIDYEEIDCKVIINDDSFKKKLTKIFVD